MGARRRIMLLEVNPLELQPPTYATLDSGFKSPNITLSGGDLIATAAPTAFGRVRATLPMVSGEYYWETKLLVRPASGYTASPGTMEESVAYTGATFGFDAFLTAAVPYETASGSSTNYWNSVAGTVHGVLAVNTVIRNWYNADTGVYKMAVAGGAWFTVHSRYQVGQQKFFPACSCSRNASFGFNFGATAFDYDVPESSRAGVYVENDPIAVPFFLSSSALNTSSSDTNPSTGYMARISSKRDLVLSRYASCYAWKERSQSSRGSLSLVNGDGGLDDWDGLLWRDTEAIILSGYEGDTRADFVEQSFELVDTVEFTDETVVIKFLDPLTTLDSPIPRRMYSSTNANSVTVNTPYPKVFGKPQYCEGVLRTTALTGNDARAIDYTDLSDIIEVLDAYDNGDYFDHLPGGGAKDYWMLQDGLGIKLQNVAAGKITAHPYGPFQYDNTTYNHILNANPFAGWSVPPTYNPPTGWTQTGTAWTATNNFTDGSLAGGSAGSAKAYTTGTQAAMYNSASSVPAGAFVIEFNVEVLTTAGYMEFVLGAARYCIRIDRVGQMRLAFSNPTGAQLVIFIGTFDYVLGAINFVFSGFKCFSAVVPEYLPDWLELFVSTYAGRNLATADVTAFVTDVNWKLAHYSDSEESISDVVQSAMDGWMGCVIPKRNGDVSVFRLEEPSSTADFELDRTQLRSVSSVEDKAPGLTTRLAGRYNNSVTDVEQIAGGATVTVRSELQKEWLIIRSGEPTNTNLGSGFGDYIAAETLVVGRQVRHADGSPPQGTLLQQEEAVQVQASKAVTLWKKSRRFYFVEVVLDAAIADLMEPGMTIKITWPRYSLIAGKNLLLVGLQTGFWSNKVKLTLWG